MQRGCGVCLLPEGKKYSFKDTFSICFEWVRGTQHNFSRLLALGWHGEIGWVQFQFHYLFSKHIRAWPAIKMKNLIPGLINTSREVPAFLGQLWPVGDRRPDVKGFSASGDGWEAGCMKDFFCMLPIAGYCFTEFLRNNHLTCFFKAKQPHYSCLTFFFGWEL